MYKGFKHSQESLDKMSASHMGQKPWNKGIFGLHLSPKTQFKKGFTPWNKGKANPNIKGEKNPAWKGGTNPVLSSIRKSTEYYEWRSDLYRRDNYTCVLCGYRGGVLNADHIIPFISIIKKLIKEQGEEDLYRKAIEYEPLWDRNNGRTLCIPCHKLTDTYGEKAKSFTI